MRRKILHYGLAVLAASTALMYAVSPVHAADKKPNWEGASAQPEAGRLELDSLEKQIKGMTTAGE